MGKVRGYKRVLAIVLAATVALVFSFSMSYAATGSPENASGVKGDNIGRYTVSKTKTATFNYFTKKKLKTYYVTNVVKRKGVTYKVTAIGKNAFKGLKNMKTLKLKGKYLKTVKTGAFNGWTKAHKKKLIVKINTKNPNKKALKNRLIKMGIPSKNIKFVKF